LKLAHLVQVMVQEHAKKPILLVLMLVELIWVLVIN